MSKFYVGQRVRLARPFYPQNLGLTGVIRELGLRRRSREGEILNCHCDWDNGVHDGSVLDGYDGTGVNTARLEPLQPERNQTIAWSECVWKPEHMRAEA